MMKRITCLILPLLLLAGVLAAPFVAPARADLVRQVPEDVRRLLLESSPANTERLCYLWRHFSAGGLTPLHQDEYVVAVPYGDNRYGCYVYSKVGQAIPAAYLCRMADAVPAVFRHQADGAVTKTGTWVASVADAGCWGGSYSWSQTAGDTIATTMAGHTLFVRLVNISNAGFATVSIDGDFTAANLLPAVTQADVDAGYFTQGQIGHRYLDTYLGTTDTDSVVALAEGLTDAAHAVTVRVQGTKRAASGGTRVYVTAFGAGSSLTRPTDAGAGLGFVRFVGDPRGGISSVAATLSYSPTGFSNFQFLGEAHGNEALVSEAFYADGSAVAPAAGAFASGQEVRVERVFTYNHPDAASCAARRYVGVARAGDPMQLRNRHQVRWNTPGTVAAFYVAMMPLSQRDPTGAATFRQATFNRLRAGNAVFPVPAANDNAVVPSAPRADYFALYSTLHDFVAVAAVSREDLAFGSGSLNPGVFFQDRNDGMDKVYLHRLGAGATEGVSAGSVHSWESAYRVFRVPAAAARLSN